MRKLSSLCTAVRAFACKKHATLGENTRAFWDMNTKTVLAFPHVNRLEHMQGNEVLVDKMRRRGERKMGKWLAEGHTTALWKDIRFTPERHLRYNVGGQKY